MNYKIKSQKRLIPKNQQGNTLNILSPDRNAPWSISPKQGSEIKMDNKFMLQFPKPLDYLAIAAPFIKQHEKFKSLVYKDGGGKDTIGYGSTAKKYISLGKITEPQALEAMNEHIKTEVIPYLESKPYFKDLGPNQKAALTSLVYNIGPTLFNNSTKLQQALRDHNWAEAIKQMDHGYNDPNNPGLKTRRDDERQLFAKDIK